MTFGGCNSPQKIKNSIIVLRPITFGCYSIPQEIQNFVEVLRLKTFKGCSTPKNKRVKPIFEKLS